MFQATPVHVDLELLSGSVRLGVKGSLVQDSPEALCCVLSRTLHPLLSTGSTQEDRKNVRT